MNAALHYHPTPTQARAASRHSAFHQKIAARAAALKAAPVPGACPHCGRNDLPATAPASVPVAEISGLSPTARIQYVVARFFKVKVSDLISERRDPEIIRPRQIAYYFAKEFTLHSWQEIGRRFSGRDHSTIHHGVRKIEGLLLKGNPELVETIAKIRSELEAVL